MHYTVTDFTKKECVSCTKFSHPRSFLYTIASTQLLQNSILQKLQTSASDCILLFLKGTKQKLLQHNLRSHLMHHWFLIAKAPSPVFHLLKELKNAWCKIRRLWKWESTQVPCTASSWYTNGGWHTWTLSCRTPNFLKLKFWDASSELPPCGQGFPCTSPYWNIQINPMTHTALQTEEDFQNKIIFSNPAKTSCTIQEGCHLW